MRKIYCEHCKREINSLPLNKAIKNKEWWKYEIRDFGWSNLLVIIAIILLFSSLYFEFGPKIKNPCDWCKVSIDNPESGIDETMTCTKWLESKYGPTSDLDLNMNISYEVNNGSITNMYS